MQQTDDEQNVATEPLTGQSELQLVQGCIKNKDSLTTDPVSQQINHIIERLMQRAEMKDAAQANTQSVPTTVKKNRRKMNRKDIRANKACWENVNLHMNGGVSEADMAKEMKASVPKSTFTVEQVELIRRLRNSGVTCQQLIVAYKAFDQIDQELGSLYSVPTSLEAVSHSFTPSHFPNHSSIPNLAFNLNISGQTSSTEPNSQSYEDLPHHTCGQTNNSFSPAIVTVSGDAGQIWSTSSEKSCVNADDISVKSEHSGLGKMDSSFADTYSNINGSVLGVVHNSSSNTIDSSSSYTGVHNFRFCDTTCYSNQDISKTELGLFDFNNSDRSYCFGNSGVNVDKLKNEMTVRKRPKSLLNLYGWESISRNKTKKIDSAEDEDQIWSRCMKCLLRQSTQSPEVLSEWIKRCANTVPTCNPSCMRQTVPELSEESAFKVLSGDFLGLPPSLKFPVYGWLVNQLRHTEWFSTCVETMIKKPVKEELKEFALQPKRERFMYQQQHIEILMKFFKDDQYPSLSEKEKIANECNIAIATANKRELAENEKLKPINVDYWYRNRRKEIRKSNLGATPKEEVQLETLTIKHTTTATNSTELPRKQSDNYCATNSSNQLTDVCSTNPEQFSADNSVHFNS